MPIVTMLNQKGGVGKTSTCHHLGGMLAQAGKRVLLVDNDPQASLTQGLLGSPEARALDPDRTIVAVYQGFPHAEQVIRREIFPRLDLLPSHKALNDYNLSRPHDRDVDEQLALDRFLGDLGERYDWILIDCPPNLLLCSWSAMVCSRGLVVPLQPEDYGAQGVVDVREAFEMVRAGLNPSLALIGYLVTMSTQRKTIHRVYEHSLRGLYGHEVFDAVVPHLADFPEAIAERKPVGQARPRSKAAQSIRILAAELEARAIRLGIHTLEGVA